MSNNPKARIQGRAGTVKFQDLSKERRTLYNKVYRAINTYSMKNSDTHELYSFAACILEDKRLDDKRKLRLKKLLENAENIRRHSRFKPSEDMIEKARIINKLISYRSQSSVKRKPKFKWCAWKLNKWLKEDDRVYYIDREVFEECFREMDKDFKNYTNPKFKKGDLCMTKYHFKDSNCGIIIKGPYLGNYSVKYDILISNEILVCTPADLKNYSRKNLKA